MSLRSRFIRYYRKVFPLAPRAPLKTKPLEVGCLAMVARPRFCCGEDYAIGIPFRVTAIEMGPCSCLECGDPGAEVLHAEVNGDGFEEVRDCIRIDDPEIEQAKSKRKVVAA